MSTQTSEMSTASNPGVLQGLKAALIDAQHGVGPKVAEALLEAGACVVTDGTLAVVHSKLHTFERTNAAADFFDACDRLAGGCDILVVCSRPVRSRPVFEMTGEELRAVVEDELVVPALYMREAARRMSARGNGRIIVFASMSGKTGVHHQVAPYAAAKGGLLAFIRVLAAETAEHGVTVNGIATALFEPQVATMTEEKRRALKSAIPVGRFGRSEEAAHAVVFLASPNAGYVTGECLNLSGGRFMD